MSREADFLITSVRTFLQTGSTPDLPGDLDQASFFRLAAAHAVTPMLDRNAETVRASLEQSAELAKVAGWLEAEGIAAISLKGPLLSRYLYGDLAMRSSGDIDLLVHREDVLRVRDVLKGHGFRIANTLHWNCDSACLRSRECELSFVSVTGPVSVDIHWRVLPGYFPSPFDHLDIWSCARKTPLADRHIYTLSAEHTLLLLCSHGAKHAFERLGWVCDVARFMMISPNLDWPAILNQARITHTSRQLLLATHLAADLLGAPLPVGLPDDPAVSSLVDATEQRVRADLAGPIPASSLVPFCLRLLETSAQRLRYLTGHFLFPSEAEYRVLRLPPAMYPLYYAFRPLRLAGEACREGLGFSDDLIAITCRAFAFVSMRIGSAALASYKPDLTCEMRTQHPNRGGQRAFDLEPRFYCLS